MRIVCGWPSRAAGSGPQITPLTHDTFAPMRIAAWDRIRPAAILWSQKVLGITDWIGQQMHVSSKWASRAGILILWGIGMTLVEVDEYAAALVLWILSVIVLLSKAIHWNGMADHPKLTRWIRFLYVLGAIAIIPVSVVWTQSKRGEKPWTALRVPGISSCSIYAQASSEIVARVYSRAAILPSGNTELYKPLFQDLFHDWVVTLAPHGKAHDVVVVIQDQHEPVDQIRVSPIGTAIITGPTKGWLSGFPEPSHVPDFYTRTVTFSILSNITTITLRRPIKSASPRTNTITSLDLDIDRLMKVSTNGCKISRSPMSDRNTRFDILSDQLRTLASRRLEGPSSPVITTRMDPDAPFPPLTVQDSELITELHCKDHPCKTFGITMEQHRGDR